MDPVLVGVKKKMVAGGLTSAEAARLIGVTQASLDKHLAGEYVRSDSLAKYRRWLSGNGGPNGIGEQIPLLKAERPPKLRVTGFERHVERKLIQSVTPPEHPHYVIDLFSGCGGLSLGFDFLEEGRIFKTVLGLDIEEPMVRAFNDNFPSGPTGWQIGRRVDLSDFVNEAEVLAFYLDHLSSVTHDDALTRALERLPEGSLAEFKSLIAAMDREFLARVIELRTSRDFGEAYGELEPTVLGQTSVAGFQQALGLPQLSAKRPEAPPLIWADCTYPGDRARESGSYQESSSRARSSRSALERQWTSEVAQLEETAAAAGKGQ